jgi:hypothetical protein
VKERAARKARNPRTGQRVDVPRKFVVTFKPGKEMEEKVRQLEERLNREDAARAASDSPHEMPSQTDGSPAAPLPTTGTEG